VTLPSIEPSELNDVVLCLERDRTSGFRDIINTGKPLHKALERAGAIMNKPRALVYETVVKFQQARRTGAMSPTQTTVAREYAENQFMTAAQYRACSMVATMTLSQYHEDMIAGGLAQFDYIKSRMDDKDQDLLLTYNDWLWDGTTVGSTPVWGLKDIIQFDPTADPTRGAVGGLGVANFPTWKNKTANYNGAYKSLAAGGTLKSMLEFGDNSLGSVYRAASNNMEAGGAGHPDIMVCNEAYMRACEGLALEGLLMKCGSGTNQLGTDSFRFKDCDITWDENVPDDPNNSSYGVAFGINCKMGFNVVYPEGLRRKVGERYKHPTMHGHAWDTFVYLFFMCHHRGLNFVHYGIQPAEDLAA
jgi:hypothetical protein